MRSLMIAFCLLIAMSAFSEPISPETRAAVLAIAERLGVPRSVADQLHVEESGDWQTGQWGDAGAVNREASGYTSEGLFQIHTEPRNLAFLVANFYPHDAKYFDIRNPIDNAVTALGYLAWLHNIKPATRGSWYLAYCYFNHGDVEHIPEATKARARRIINARWRE